MKINRLRKSALLSVTTLLIVTTAPRLLSTLTPLPVVAQAPQRSTATNPAFPMLEKVAADTKLSIDGSSSMAGINAALKKGFEGKYAGSSVTIASGGTDAALKALKENKVQLAAIGRSLTEAEKAEGLVEVPVARHKIAMFVGSDSPFQGSLTIQQFAKIFRGEVSNWNEVGGPDAPVNLVDRPETSDIRQAFRNYPKFGELKAGANAVAVEDETPAVIAKLGKDGISYGIAEQVVDQPGVRTVMMYGTSPTDPKYPFSQPLVYVYKGPEASDAVKAFLGYATAPENQAIIDEARVASVTPGATASPATSPSPTVAESPAASPSVSETIAAAPTTTATDGSSFPWGWLLLLPLLALPFFLFRGRKEETGGAPVAPPKPVPPAPVPAAAPVAAPVSPAASQIILTPRDCRDAYAYWELSAADKATLRQVGHQPKLRLYEVTDIPNMDMHPPHSMEEFDIDLQDQDQHLPIAVDDRDYLVEVGYRDNAGRWVKLARSAHIRVPACPPNNPVTSAASGLVDGLKGGVANLGSTVSGTVAGAAGAVSGVTGAVSSAVSGTTEAVTGTISGAVSSTGATLSNLGSTVADAGSNLAGQATNLAGGAAEAATGAVTGAVSGATGMTAGAAGLAAGAVAGAAAIGGGMAAKAGESLFGDDGLFGGLFSHDEKSASDTAPAATAASTATTEKIILVPRDAHNAYAYWEVPEAEKALVRKQGGKELKLRLYDVTDINLDTQPPHSAYEYACSETDPDLHLPIYKSDRDYVVELGYTTDDGRWLKLTRSAAVRVPAG